jgi:hypothetical protein
MIDYSLFILFFSCEQPWRDNQWSDKNLINKYNGHVLVITQGRNKDLALFVWKVTNTQISQKTEENEWTVFTIILRALHLTASSTMSTIPNTWIYVFSGVRVAQSSVFCVVFYRSLFVLLSFSIWPLHCQYFCEWRLLVTPVVSSKLSVQLLVKTGPW